MATVGAERKFAIYSQFLDTTLWAEEERLPGESIEEGEIRVIKQLEGTAARLRKEYEAMTGVQVQAYGKSVIHPETDKAEDTLTAIKQAHTMEVLSSFKLLANSDSELRKAYMDKVKELTK